MHLPLYYRLLKLNLTNTTLLDTYQKLSSEIGEIEEESQLEFGKRISLRKHIQKDLLSCLRKIRIAKKASFVYRTSNILFPPLVQLEHSLQRTITPTGRERYRKFELHNVNQYYSTLYSGRLPRRITDILLEHKKRIEQQLLEEM